MSYNKRIWSGYGLTKIFLRIKRLYCDPEKDWGKSISKIKSKCKKASFWMVGEDDVFMEQQEDQSDPRRGIHVVGGV